MSIVSAYTYFMDAPLRTIINNKSMNKAKYTHKRKAMGHKAKYKQKKI